MTAVALKSVPERLLAAVHRTFPVGGAGAVWRPALDLVWAFLQTQPGLRTDGHNVFLYRMPDRPGGPASAHFGVEVVRTFVPTGEVAPLRTPAGVAAVATHVGSYADLHRTHDAVATWARNNNHALAGVWWEVYGDPTPDPAKTETVVGYLLR